MALDPATVETLNRVYAETGNKTEAARQAGVARQTAIDHLSAKDDEPVQTSIGGDDNHTNVEWLSDKPITLDDALTHCKVDQSIWRVKDYQCGSWQVAMKLRAGKDQPETPAVQQCWKITLKLERIWPKSITDASEALFERLAKIAPTSWPKITRQPRRDPHLLVIGLFDAHFGKLAWGDETGENYDLAIASTIFKRAVEDLICYSEGFGVDQVLLPIGSDFFHVDGLESSTTRGTRVDSDGRYGKMIEVGEHALIESIGQLLTIAPVSICWIPGNHDKVASFHVARTIRAYFRTHPDVSVDVGPKIRKYHKYGANLIGVTHGDTAAANKLPIIMATEQPSDWAESNCREWLIGHTHKSKRVETTPVDTHEGVAVRTLQSLSGRDAWHYEEGYVGGRRAGEALLYAKTGGMVANFQATARS